MKKALILVIIVVILSLFLTMVLVAESRDDIQAIKKAVKKNPSYKPGNEVKWFKLVVTDNQTRKERVRMTLPVVLIEYFIQCSGDKHFRIKRDDCQVDLRKLFQDLKKLGPMSVVEIYEDEVTVRVWFE